LTPWSLNLFKDAPDPKLVEAVAEKFDRVAAAWKRTQPAQ
jgi:hypothetical protein